MNNNLLVEQTLFEYKVIKDEHGKKLRGLFQKANCKNENGRVYNKEVLAREVQKLVEAVKNRSLVGQLDHPQTATIEYAKASHLITGLQVNESDIYGELEILNTPSGKIVESLVDANVKIGISSRGLGTTRKEMDESGSEIQVVNDDFQLITWDVVAEPSTPGAYLQLSENTLRRIFSKDTKPANFKHEIYKIVDEFLRNKK